MSGHTRPRVRPRRARVSFKGIEHWMDVMVCEHALVRRQVEGEFETLEDVARAANVSRSTVSRFLCGRGTSLTVSLRMLAALKLAFDEVFTRCDDVVDGDHERGGRTDPTGSEPLPLEGRAGFR